MNTSTKIFVLLSLLLLAGCENSLVVKGDFPSPLVDKIPHTLGVYYEPEFSTYIYEEKSSDRSVWKIAAGEAQLDLLSKVLPELFEQVVFVDALPQEGQRIDADLIFSPRIEEFQYAMPRETKINVYEIWIKYNMRVYNGQGQLLADWLMTAYGKTPTAFMKSKEDAVNQAAVMALRDMGASLSLRFPQVPEIKTWLADHRADAAASQDPAAQLDITDEQNFQVQPDLAAQQDPKPQADATVEQDPQPQTEATAEQDPQPQTEAMAEQDPQPQTEATAEQDPQPQTKAMAEQDPQPQTKAMAEQDPQPQTEATTKQDPQPQPDLAVQQSHLPQVDGTPQQGEPNVQ